MFETLQATRRARGRSYPWPEPVRTSRVRTDFRRCHVGGTVNTSILYLSRTLAHAPRRALLAAGLLLASAAGCAPAASDGEPVPVATLEPSQAGAGTSTAESKETLLAHIELSNGSIKFYERDPGTVITREFGAAEGGRLRDLDEDQMDAVQLYGTSPGRALRRRWSEPSRARFRPTRRVKRAKGRSKRSPQSRCESRSRKTRSLRVANGSVTTSAVRPIAIASG